MQLINDILDISKIASGKMTLNYSKFYLKEIVLQTVENVKSYVVDKQLKVNLTFEPDDFMIEADAAKLKQILYNLLSNAVKFTRQGGEIEIYVYRREDAAEFIVRDNGIGIAEQDQARVFVEFEQVDSSYTREYEGTGLGLPLVKKMVEMHGGYVYLKSALGQGTEVIFLIPLQPKIQKQ
ncbi:MAG: ATP-binding protein [Acidaminococcaceae bacterium]|nr:ATP-binding protein [Acidaminococcaceae bacterium]